MAETVLTEIDDGVGIITLNRPERHNAFDEALIAELTAALHEMRAADPVRVVVLSSAGSTFCSGADLGWMQRAAGWTEDHNYEDALALGTLLRTLNELPKPTIARVQGSAYGGGVGLIAACDIAIGTYGAQFALSEVKLGLIPALIGPYVIAAIGERKARRYMLTGERFSASEAWRIGLLHEIVPDEDALDEALVETVQALLMGGPRAQAACKALIHTVSHRPIDEDVIDYTARRITAIRASEEGQEGVAAFLEKSQPSWGGA